MISVAQAFSNDGALAKAIDGFSPRQAQTDMALEVASAIKKNNHLLLLKQAQEQVKPLLISYLPFLVLTLPQVVMN